MGTTKLMGILSVVQYLFSNPRSPLLSNMKTQQETKTEDKNRSSSTIENKDTSSKVDPPRILSAPSWDSINNSSFFSDGMTSPGDSPPWGWFVSLSPHSELFPSRSPLSSPDRSSPKKRGEDTTAPDGISRASSSNSSISNQVVTKPKNVVCN